MEPHLSPQVGQNNAAYTRLAARTNPEVKSTQSPAPRIAVQEPQSVYSHVYSPVGNIETTSSYRGDLLNSYRQTRSAISQQVSVLLRHYRSPDRGAAAKSDTVESPQISQSNRQKLAELAEYWNRENTARRIFDIALLGFQQGEDKQEFSEKAISIVKQAYHDVAAVIGIDFPDVVQATKKTVLDALQQFGAGSERDQVSFV